MRPLIALYAVHNEYLGNCFITAESIERGGCFVSSSNRCDSMPGDSVSQSFFYPCGECPCLKCMTPAVIKNLERGINDLYQSHMSMISRINCCVMMRSTMISASAQHSRALDEYTDATSLRIDARILGRPRELTGPFRRIGK
jgi:hypothetical protein